jgi:hypothetical protein
MSLHEDIRPKGEKRSEKKVATTFTEENERERNDLAQLIEVLYRRRFHLSWLGAPTYWAVGRQDARVLLPYSRNEKTYSTLLCYTELKEWGREGEIRWKLGEGRQPLP